MASQTTQDAGPAERPDDGKPSRAARIWRRTWFGALLAAGVTGLLWLTHSLDSGRPVWICGALLALAAIVEVSLMGRLQRDRLPVTLVFPWVAIVLVEDIELARSSPTPYLLGLEYIWVAALATTVFVISHLLSDRRWLRNALLLVASLGMVATVHWVHSDDAPTWMVLSLWIGLAFLAGVFIVRSNAARDSWLRSAVIALWLVVPLPAMTQIWSGYGLGGLAALLVLSKVGDIAGYYFGNAMGRTHPFPKLSPGKTTAGCVASLIAGTLAGGAFVALDVLPRGALGITSGFLAGLVVNLASQAGDLTESALKRYCGVKDSSTWLGPSGGVLDVVDSLLLSVPVALITWPFLFGN